MRGEKISWRKLWKCQSYIFYKNVSLYTDKQSKRLNRRSFWPHSRDWLYVRIKKKRTKITGGTIVCMCMHAEHLAVWRQRQHLKRNHRLSQRRKQLVNNEIMAIIALVACLVAILHTLLQLQGQYFSNYLLFANIIDRVLFSTFILFEWISNVKFK